MKCWVWSCVWSWAVSRPLRCEYRGAWPVPFKAPRWNFFSKMSMVSRPTYWQGLSLANISLDISRNHSGISTYRQNDTDRATPCRPLPRLPFKPSRLSSKYAGNKKDNLSRGWRIQDAMEHIAVQQRSTKCLHLQKWLELCCCSTDILSGHIGSSQAPMLA